MMGDRPQIAELEIKLKPPHTPGGPYPLELTFTRPDQYSRAQPVRGEASFDFIVLLAPFKCREPCAKIYDRADCLIEEANHR